MEWMKKGGCVIWKKGYRLEFGKIFAFRKWVEENKLKIR